MTLSYILITTYLISGVINCIVIIKYAKLVNKEINKVDNGFINPNVYKVVLCVAPVLNTLIALGLINDASNKVFVYIKWNVRKYKRVIK